MGSKQFSEGNSFKKKAKKFRIDTKTFDEQIESDIDFFNELYNLKESIKSELKSELKNISAYNKEEKRELLEDISKQVFDLLISQSDTYEIFNSFVEFIPAYLKRSSEDVSEDVNENEIAEFLNQKISRDLFMACLFSSLCAYIELTKKIESFSVPEFIYAIFEDISLDIESYSFTDIKESRERMKWEDGLDHSYNNEVDKFKMWRNRNLKKIVPRKRGEALYLSEVHAMSIIHSVVFDDRDDFKYGNMGRLNKLYDAIREAKASPRDEGYKERVNSACDAALAKLKNIKYRDYLKQSKYFLNEINKNKHFRGITLYKFEKAHNLFQTTSYVNELVKATSGYEVFVILLSSFTMQFVRFPSLCTFFSYTACYEDLANCVLIYLSLLNKFTFANSLIIDELVECGYFGEGDNRFEFLLETISEMSDIVLYTPDEIDFSVRHFSQDSFELLLSFPINMKCESDEDEDEEEDVD